MARVWGLFATVVCALCLGCVEMQAQTNSPNASAAPASETTPEEKAQVMILAVSHFTSTSDVLVPEQPDVFTEKSQREIGEIARRIALFKPTIVALELPYDSDVPAKTYTAYLEGKHALTASEREQLGFRIAKLAGLKRIEPIDYKNEWPFDRVATFAKQHNQDEIVKSAIRPSQQLLEEFNRTLRVEGILSALIYINSKRALALRQATEMLSLRVGSGENYVGVELETSFYARNLRIFANLTRAIKSADDRVLVIYGAGHAPLLRQFVMDSPDLRLVDPNEYLAH